MRHTNCLATLKHMAADAGTCTCANGHHVVCFKTALTQAAAPKYAALRYAGTKPYLVHQKGHAVQPPGPLVADRLQAPIMEASPQPPPLHQQQHTVSNPPHSTEHRRACGAFCLCWQPKAAVARRCAASATGRLLPAAPHVSAEHPGEVRIPDSRPPPAHAAAPRGLREPRRRRRAAAATRAAWRSGGRAPPAARASAPPASAPPTGQLHSIVQGRTQPGYADTE